MIPQLLVSWAKESWYSLLGSIHMYTFLYCHSPNFFAMMSGPNLHTPCSISYGYASGCMHFPVTIFIAAILASKSARSIPAIPVWPCIFTILAIHNLTLRSSSRCLTFTHTSACLMSSWCSVKTSIAHQVDTKAILNYSNTTKTHTVYRRFGFTSDAFIRTDFRCRSLLCKSLSHTWLSW